MSLDAIGEIVAIKRHGTPEEFLSSHSFTDLLKTHDGFAIRLKLRDDFRDVSERAENAEKALLDTLAVQKAATEATVTKGTEKAPVAGTGGSPAAAN